MQSNWWDFAYASICHQCGRFNLLSSIVIRPKVVEYVVEVVFRTQEFRSMILATTCFLSTQAFLRLHHFCLQPLPIEIEEIQLNFIFAFIWLALLFFAAGSNPGACVSNIVLFNPFFPLFFSAGVRDQVSLCFSRFMCTCKIFVGWVM